MKEGGEEERGEESQVGGGLTHRDGDGHSTEPLTFWGTGGHGRRVGPSWST